MEKVGFKNKVANKVKNIASAMGAAMAVIGGATPAYAFDNVSSVDTSGATATTGMNAVIGVLLTITRYAGIALLIFGVYEVVMSFMQNQPEAKTKGIIMALCGVVMISLKTLISAFGVTIA